jgi:hypothetical protein
VAAHALADRRRVLDETGQSLGTDRAQEVGAEAGELKEAGEQLVVGEFELLPDLDVQVMACVRAGPSGDEHEAADRFRMRGGHGRRDDRAERVSDQVDRSAGRPHLPHHGRDLLREDLDRQLSRRLFRRAAARVVRQHDRALVGERVHEVSEVELRGQSGSGHEHQRRPLSRGGVVHGGSVGVHGWHGDSFGARGSGARHYAES